MSHCAAISLPSCFTPPWAARNQAGTAQPAEGDRECRWPPCTRPPPQLPPRIAPAPGRPPTARIPSYKGWLPRLHHHPHRSPPASRPAPPRGPGTPARPSIAARRRGDAFAAFGIKLTSIDYKYNSKLNPDAFAALTITQHTEHDLGTGLGSYATI